jgi:thiol-disulfide isomerase/thioredoxin
LRKGLEGGKLDAGLSPGQILTVSDYVPAEALERCPKCDAERLDDDTCHACGVVFSRYRPESAQLAAVNRILARQRRPRSNAPLLFALVLGVVGGAYAALRFIPALSESGPEAIGEGSGAALDSADEPSPPTTPAELAPTEGDDDGRDWSVELALREDIALSDLAKRHGIGEGGNVVIPRPPEPEPPLPEPSRAEVLAAERAGRCGPPRENPARVRAVAAAEIRTQVVRARPCPVVVMLYASWCPSCRAILPEVVGLARQAPGGTQVLAFSVDSEDAALAAYLGENRLPFEAVRIDEGGVEAGRVLSRLGASYPGSIPYFALIDDGSVLVQGTGAGALSEITALIAR